MRKPKTPNRVRSSEIVMPMERWKALMANDDQNLTTEEIADGWHFCWEWDGLLIRPGMKELECCTCKSA